MVPRTVAVVMLIGLLGGAEALAQPPAHEKNNPAGRKAAQTKPGQSFKECRNCPEMVVVPPGTFMMGSPADEPERRETSGSVG